jgi:hypothetical protein
MKCMFEVLVILGETSWSANVGIGRCCVPWGIVQKAKRKSSSDIFRGMTHNHYGFEALSNILTIPPAMISEGPIRTWQSKSKISPNYIRVLFASMGMQPWASSSAHCRGR